jgi:tRNA uridine 5-carboxymethylaminomethyl modification enzyme
VGSTLAQLLKRPEIVIEDLAPVVRESYREYFNEIDEFSKSQQIDGDAVVSGHDMSRAASGQDNLGCGPWQLSSAARNEMKTVETEIKYSGYLDQQRKSIERLKKAEERAIPEWFDYTKVSGLSREMNEKLQRVRPRTLGQASRIPGVTPAAVSLINVYIELQGRSLSRA